MKKLFNLLLVLCLTLGLTACGGKEKAENELLVSATLDPHAKILEEAAKILEENYDISLEVKVLDDYYIFNEALNEGEVDANYFQHRPFFDDEVKNKGYDIVEAAGIHLEPFGFYSQNISSVDELKDGDTVIISNSKTDNGRILGILVNAGLITIKDGVEVLNATINDIASNPKNLQFEEVKPELLATYYKNKEGAMVAINGNYALQAGLNSSKDALLIEKADANNPYVNIVAVQKGKESDEKIKALVEVLKSDEIKTFIENTYQGSVIVAE